MRTITVRECPCDGTNCGPRCGSTMVDRPYVEARAIEELRKRVRAVVREWACYPEFYPRKSFADDVLAALLGDDA